MFAQPRYQPTRGGGGQTLHFDEAKPPVNGWLYADATPGFHFGEHKNLWNISLLLPREVPAGAGILASSRVAPHVVVIAQAVPKARGWNMFITGVVRSDVIRVTVHARAATERHGLIATTRIRFSKPGDALYCASALRGVCGISAQRRS